MITSYLFLFLRVLAIRENIKRVRCMELKLDVGCFAILSKIIILYLERFET